MFKAYDVVVTTQDKVGLILATKQKVYNKKHNMFNDLDEVQYVDESSLTEDEVLVDVACVEFGETERWISFSKLKLVQKVKFACKQFGNEWEMIVAAKDMEDQSMILKNNKIYFQVFER